MKMAAVYGETVLGRCTIPSAGELASTPMSWVLGNRLGFSDLNTFLRTIYGEMTESCVVKE